VCITGFVNIFKIFQTPQKIQRFCKGTKNWIANHPDYCFYRRKFEGRITFRQNKQQKNVHGQWLNFIVGKSLLEL
jgi:hypothetical protein